MSIEARLRKLENATGEDRDALPFVLYTMENGGFIMHSRSLPDEGAKFSSREEAEAAANEIADKLGRRALVVEVSYGPALTEGEAKDL